MQPDTLERHFKHRNTERLFEGNKYCSSILEIVLLKQMEWSSWQKKKGFFGLGRYLETFTVEEYFILQPQFNGMGINLEKIIEDLKK